MRFAWLLISALCFVTRVLACREAPGPRDTLGLFPMLLAYAVTRVLALREAPCDFLPIYSLILITSGRIRRVASWPQLFC